MSDSARRNPFRFSGPLAPADMIDREEEAEALFALADGGHSSRLIGPRRYGKTTLFRRVLDEADKAGMATVLVDLQDVLTIGEIVVRIERAYARRLKGPVRRRVDAILKSWNIGLSLGAQGFAANLQRNPQLDAETVLLRLLELPVEIAARDGSSSLIVFDEIQDVLAVPGADGKIRSVIQHHLDVASYAFAGSAPGAMRKLFEDPSRPLLEQAVAKDLAPLPLDAVADYVEQRFEATGRAVGHALDPLVEFTRGHPQRSMMLAHLVWAHTRPGEPADERVWIAARDEALAAVSALMQATWRSLPLNERRVALALATVRSPLYSEETAAAVGIKRSTIRGALAGLRDRGDVVEGPTGELRLTDPIFELWLERRGLEGAGEDGSAEG
jgi:uncharacterized protein